MAVHGDCNVVIKENGEIKTVKVRSLFYKLQGKIKASKKSADCQGTIKPENKIEIQVLDKNESVNFNLITRAQCFKEPICKLRGDRISLKSGFGTVLYDKNKTWISVSDVYPIDNMIKYINLKNEVTYDWVVKVSVDESAGSHFTYNFYTDNQNFICNRIVVKDAF